jgi:predicted aspartyl protease
LNKIGGMHKKFLPLYFFIVTPFCSQAQEALGFVITGGKSQVEIPIEIQNNLITVPVVINKQVPLRFILDTGVRTAILTEKIFADILNLPYSRKYFISGPGGNRIAEAFVTNNVTLDLPGVHGQGLALLVLDQDYLELRNYLGTDVHGILGYELFSRFVIKIDYQRKVMVIQNPEKFIPKRKFEMVPIKVEDTKPYIEAKVQMSDESSAMVKLLIDTGAGHGLILEPDSGPAIKVPSNHINSIIGRGLGGIITGQIGRIEMLELGNYKIPEVITNFPDPNSYMDSIKNNRTIFRNGAIGGEILSRFTVIFNLPYGKVYFKKNSAYKKKFYFNQSGLSLKAEGVSLRRFRIVDVRTNSAAEKADIKSGDVVLKINNISSGGLELNNINALLNSKPGKKISLEIERDGKIVKRQFLLENPI